MGISIQDRSQDGARGRNATGQATSLSRRLCKPHACRTLGRSTFSLGRTSPSSGTPPTTTNLSSCRIRVWRFPRSLGDAAGYPANRCSPSTQWRWSIRSQGSSHVIHHPPGTRWRRIPRAPAASDARVVGCSSRRVAGLKPASLKYAPTAVGTTVCCLYSASSVSVGSEPLYSTLGSSIRSHSSRRLLKAYTNWLARRIA